MVLEKEPMLETVFPEGQQPLVTSPARATENSEKEGVVGRNCCVLTVMPLSPFSPRAAHG